MILFVNMTVCKRIDPFEKIDQTNHECNFKKTDAKSLEKHVKRWILDSRYTASMGLKRCPTATGN